MPNIPFTVYDFFGYLASGFLMMTTAIYVGTNKSIFCYEFNFILSVFLILVAYIIGHIIAVPAKLFYERFIVGKILGYPSGLLFLNESSSGCLATIFPEYFVSFPKEIAEKIEAKMGTLWNDEKARFDYAYGKVKTNKDALARLDIFLSLYGFCRNVSFAFLVIFFLIGFFGWNRGILLNLVLCVISLLAFSILFYKYLKFFRFYSYEMYLYYLELPFPKEPPNSKKNRVVEVHVTFNKK